MDRGGGDQGPLGSTTGDPQRTADSPRELADKERSDPNQTGDAGAGGGGEQPESGAGYGNHAMPDVPADEPS